MSPRQSAAPLAPPPISVQVAAPADEPRWLDRLGGHPGLHLAHAPQWTSVLAAAYGHTARTLVAADPEGPAGVLPVVLLRRPLASGRLVSMPFLDGGGPCARSPEAARALVDRLLEEARAAGVAGVELRTGQPLPLGAPPRTHKVNMVLPLPATADALWRSFAPKVRNQVRKAERSGLRAVAGGQELLDDFYGVFAENMRDLGSPVHGRDFFAHALAAFGPAARVLLVRRDQITVGGLVSLAFQQTVYVPWASCLRRHAAACPNMLLYWAILERSVAEGARRLDFGRSTRGGGTHQFKRQWGAQEVPLYWYSLAPDGGPAPAPSEEGALARRVGRLWQRLPVAVSRVLGPRIRKHLPQ
jgi:FemAB-related protein (PEP-CTERM system-associated)